MYDVGIALFGIIGCNCSSLLCLVESVVHKFGIQYFFSEICLGALGVYDGGKINVAHK